MKAFKHITSTKKILKNSRPHAEMVYWALCKVENLMTEAERIQYEHLMKEVKSDLEKYFRALDLEGETITEAACS